MNKLTLADHFWKPTPKEVKELFPERRCPNCSSGLKANIENDYLYCPNLCEEGIPENLSQKEMDYLDWQREELNQLT